MRPHAWPEAPFVEQSAIALFAELGWRLARSTERGKSDQ